MGTGRLNSATWATDMLLKFCTKRLHKSSTLTRCRRWSSVNVESASAVVIGGGAVGSSIAYHLAKRGLKNVVLLESSVIGGGNSTQPPGFTSYTHPVTRYNRLMVDSAQLYADLAHEGIHELKLERPGTIRLGVSDRRLAEFQYYHAKDKTGRSRLLKPAEVAEICPFVDHTKISGALFSEGDGFLDTSGLSKALAMAAEKLGVQVKEGVAYQGMARLEEEGLWEVTTDKGKIRAINVVNAAGLAARDIAADVGVTLPLVDILHHYSVFNPCAELQNATRPVPAIVDHESNWYIRPYNDRFLFGAFEDKKDVRLAGINNDGAAATERQKAAAMATIPLLEEVGIASESEGRLAISPDGLPVVGPVRNVPNYWVAAGFFDGVATAGGVGKYMAEWLHEQEPPYELVETCASRFDDWMTRHTKLERAKESYSMTLNWSVRPEDRMGGRPCYTRISGIYSALCNDDAHMYYRNGWEVAGWFGPPEEPMQESLRREYELVTTNVGVIDVSYKGLIEVSGADREAFLDVALSFPPPRVGTMSEGLMLTPKGRIFSHCKLLHHEKNFLLVCSPEQENRNLRWLECMALESPRKWDVHFSKVSAYLSSLKVTGPKAAELLNNLTVANMATFPYKGARVIRLAGVPGIVVGFCETGEPGFAVFHSRADTLRLYSSLMREGERLGVGNFGFKTQNILRMEKGIRRDGKELSLDYTAVEAGVEDLVHMDKADFVGKAAMTELLAGDRRWQTRLCRMPTKYASPRGAEVVRRNTDHQVVGHVTSGCYSFAEDAPLCFAVIDTASVQLSEELMVDYGNELVPAHVMEKPPREIHSH